VTVWQAYNGVGMENRIHLYRVGCFDPALQPMPTLSDLQNRYLKLITPNRPS
jgi:hypothetical protein